MVKRKIILCSESQKVVQSPLKPPEKYSIDGEAIVNLLKNNIAALRAGAVEIEPIGFNGKDEFMKRVPNFVKNKFAEYREKPSKLDKIEVFVIALTDADTAVGQKIAGLRQKLSNQIKKLIPQAEFRRVYFMFAVQAIEAWLLADERKLNEYLGEANKIKRENDPEKIDNPKQRIESIFRECGRQYETQDRLSLLPQLRISELQRCKHFNEFYNCITTIVNASGPRIS